MIGMKEEHVRSTDLPYGLIRRTASQIITRSLLAFR